MCIILRTISQKSEVSFVDLAVDVSYLLLPRSGVSIVDRIQIH